MWTSLRIAFKAMIDIVRWVFGRSPAYVALAGHPGDVFPVRRLEP
jgi:hypothetical protein